MLNKIIISELYGILRSVRWYREKWGSLVVCVWGFNFELNYLGEFCV